MTPLVSVLGIVALAAAPAQSAPRPEPGPGVRNAHAAVYDARTRALLLFGGATSDQVRGDTWRWQSGKWSLIAAAGPAPRTFPAMAADSARGEIVLFGGNPVLFGDAAAPLPFFGDTWILRGNRWTRVSQRGPSARAEAAVGYDPVRRRTVLFGGRVPAPGGRSERLGDTWEWDGAAWTRLATTGPSPRSGAAMAYHPGLRAVVLFGGSGGPLGDTWSWNGRSWSRVAVPLAPGRFNPVMAWNPAPGTLVRFGGWDGSRRTADTWELRDSGWVRLQGSGPSPRNHAVLISHWDRGSVMLYGGHDGDRVLGDLWELRDGRWMLIDSVASLRRVENGH